MKNKKIILIDETLREGMQYRGTMFSIAQRLKILDFQEQLGVDICQAGYPPAHAREADAVKTLVSHGRKNRYKIRVAAMGRATRHDTGILMATGANDLHLHVHLKNNMSRETLDNALADLSNTIQSVRKHLSHAVLSIAMLDIGRSDAPTLDRCVTFLSHQGIDMISLPDTSGMMAPNQVFDKILRLSGKTRKTHISIHCHNDLGMASANAVMGILAGGRVLEASALGIGERNGIADLYTTAKTLQNQGYTINMDTDNLSTFKAYYAYVDAIVYEQQGHHLLDVNTPVFGDAVKTHVAGTHAGGDYGLATEEHFFLNILCSKLLVKKYLAAHAMACPADRLDLLTEEIKSTSSQLNRCLTRTDIQRLISLLH
ncbi:hypothetical protein [Desulfobacula sp.]|uniref:hypothetical protein n=1 Tax=Desulfobacula sp. TaxID=2593537 RepID=UPI00260E6FFA|nr:hypothetical protein [Desulfobacula sp.]